MDNKEQNVVLQKAIHYIYQPILAMRHLRVSTGIGGKLLGGLNIVYLFIFLMKVKTGKLFWESLAYSKYWKT